MIRGDGGIQANQFEVLNGEKSKVAVFDENLGEGLQSYEVEPSEIQSVNLEKGD